MAHSQSTNKPITRSQNLHKIKNNKNKIKKKYNIIKKSKYENDSDNETLYDSNSEYEYYENDSDNETLYESDNDTLYENDSDNETLNDTNSENDSNSESEYENDLIYCNICSDILLNHIYGNVCKKHIPSYSLYDLETYDEASLEELNTLPRSKLNKLMTPTVLADSFKFFDKNKKYMSINEKVLSYIILFKNTCSKYFETNSYNLKCVIINRCDTIINDDFFVSENKLIKKKFISYAKNIKKLL